MREYDIRGVKVAFPYDAYDLQVSYMDRLIQALQERNHALLESPTGTGKTLCLLCASVAWRQSMIDKGGFSREATVSQPPQPSNAMQAMLAGAKSKEEESQVPPSPPPIVYSSRTHSQLQQAMREVKKMNEGKNLKCTVLGSRQQLCVNPAVNKLQGSVASLACKKAVIHKACAWNQRLQSDYIGQTEILDNVANRVMDIEDLGILGRGTGPCPYFLTREIAKFSDIVFLPYNYLIDKRQRERLPIDLNGSIVIFDEAHNVEQCCSDAASFEFQSPIFKLCQAEIARARELIQNKSEEKPMPKTGSWGGLRERCLTLQKSLSAMEDHIIAMKIPAEGKSHPGTEIYCLLEKGTIYQSNHKVLADALYDVADVLAAFPNSKATGNACSIMSENLVKAFDAMDRPEHGAPEYHKAFRVHYRLVSTGKKASGPPIKQIAFWCFSPAIAMRQLCLAGMTSLILTSGTLSPMDTFAHELKLKFPIRLENNHVIKPTQAWVGVVPVGPSNHPMDSSYKCRDDPRYKDDLGSAIVNFSRVVPDGLLVFFPSYIVMQGCLDHWKVTRDGNPSIWERILQYKQIVVEPRESSLFQTAIDDYRKKLRSPLSSGCVFFSVCRGKVSEGLDFADSMGRAVIVAGIPYAQLKEPQVILKREVLDAQLKHNKGGGGLSGAQWYKQTAIRAVNQAMGRVIRHRHDFGAIIMCDRRFADSGMQRQVSLWLRSMLKVHRNFGSAVGTLTRFFKDKKADPGLDFVLPCDSKETSFDFISKEGKNNLSANSSSSRRPFHPIGDTREAKRPRLVIPPASEMQNCSDVSTLSRSTFAFRQDLDANSGLLDILESDNGLRGGPIMVKEEEKPNIKIEQKPLVSLISVKQENTMVKKEEEKPWFPNMGRVKMEEQGGSVLLGRVKREHPMSGFFRREVKTEGGGAVKTEKYEEPCGINSASGDSSLRSAPAISSQRAKTNRSAKELIADVKAVLAPPQFKKVVNALAEYRKRPNEEGFVSTLIELLATPEARKVLPGFGQFMKNKQHFAQRLRQIGIAMDEYR
ncbi:hypothetical protein BSKO_04904 [Bryopsis sp. KO-2023]|nr:hypothetical protein BSKO_04904 [Bryopsis sp. KO-2023]